MKRPTYRGIFPIKKPDRYLFSSQGNAVVQEWIGPRNLIYGMVGAMRNFYETVEVDPESNGLLVTVRGTSRSTINGEVELPVITFELTDEEQLYDLAFHPRYAALTYAEIAFVEDALTNHWNSAEFLSNYTDGSDADPTHIRQAYFNRVEELYYKRLRGQSSYVDSIWAFTRTMSVSKYYPTTIDLSNHNRVWTLAQVEAYCGTLPNIILPNITADAAQSAAGLQYGWFKFRANVTLATRGGFNLVESWRIALWDTPGIYSAAT